VVQLIEAAQQRADYKSIIGNIYNLEDYFAMFENETVSSEECKNVYFQCGAGNWNEVSVGDKIDSGCKIKIAKKGSYCHFLLPDGSLLSAFNAGAFEEENHPEKQSNLDLIFQINLGANETRILQNVTIGKSGIWHFLPENHKKYIVEIGDYETEFLGTGAITGSPSAINSSMSSVKIEVTVIWGKVVVRRNPVYYPNSTDSVTINENPGNSPSFKLQPFWLKIALSHMFLVEMAAFPEQTPVVQMLKMKEAGVTAALHRV